MIKIVTLSLESRLERFPRAIPNLLRCSSSSDGSCFRKLLLDKRSREESTIYRIKKRSSAVGRANGKSALDVNGCIFSPWNVLLLTLNAELIQAQVLEANLE